MKILTHARIRSLLPAAFFLLICAGLASCGKVASGANASQKHSQGSQTIPVSVATVQRRDFPVYLNGLGSVKAFNTVALKSRVDGQLVQVAFREGQEVRKGDLLAVIDPRPYAGPGNGLRTPSPAGYHHCGRINGQPGADAVHHPGGLPLHGSGATVGQAHAWPSGTTVGPGARRGIRLNAYCSSNSVNAPVSP